MHVILLANAQSTASMRMYICYASPFCPFCQEYIPYILSIAIHLSNSAACFYVLIIKVNNSITMIFEKKLKDAKNGNPVDSGQLNTYSQDTPVREY